MEPPSTEKKKKANFQQTSIQTKKKWNEFRAFKTGKYTYKLSYYENFVIVVV